MALFIDVVLLRYKPQYTWPGLFIVLLGHSGLLHLVAARTIALQYDWTVSIDRRDATMTDLFAKKPLELLIQEAQETGSHSLKRTLGVFQLTALGVGAVIGAGIFVLSGLGAHYAGPGLMLSFVLSGLGCAFAALCYAEFAAMIPLAGSAYTYAYATLGEIFAWIIGWDLTLEYAMGASTVSSAGPTTSSSCSISSTSRCRCGWLTTTGPDSRGGKHRRPPDGAGIGFHAGSRHPGFPAESVGDHEPRNRPSCCSERTNC